MALVRWEPARELYSVQHELNRLFGSLFDSPTGAGRRGAFRRWIPPIDLVEEGEQYVRRADLPGLSEDEVKVEVQDLTISGERKSEREERKGGYYRVERASGAFSRSLTLPEGVDQDAIQAHFDKGVLEVRVPKPEQRKPHRVAISGGDAGPALEGKSETS